MLAFEISYLLLLSLISMYGLQRAVLAVEFLLGSKREKRRAASDLAEDPGAELPVTLEGKAAPRVLLQLPVYNDGVVFLRLLESVEKVDWPIDRLEIQVLDDSDDGSSASIAVSVARLHSRGYSIEHVQRSDRTGFKAGALAEGLPPRRRALRRSLRQRLSDSPAVPP